MTRRSPEDIANELGETQKRLLWTLKRLQGTASNRTWNAEVNPLFAKIRRLHTKLNQAKETTPQDSDDWPHYWGEHNSDNDSGL